MRSSPYSSRSRRFRRIPPTSRRVRIPTWAETPRFRAILVWAILMTGVGILAIRLFIVQVIQGPTLRAYAESQQIIQVRPFVPRRQIVDRNGNTLAIDRPVYSLFAHPKLFKVSHEEVARQLAPILNQPIGELLKQLNERDSGIRLDYALNEDATDRINDLGLDGLELISAQERLYPHQELAADIIGYVNDEQVGQAGVELSQQSLLERNGKALQLRRMGDGSIMPDFIPGGFLSVDDLHLALTIDSKLQHVVSKALQTQVQAFNAKRGTVIVMDVNDGAVVALANQPTFNPNEYYKAPLEALKNWAITDLYEPGSTFKPIVVAMALEAKTITPDSPISAPGELYVDGSQIVGSPTSSVSEVIAQSSNTGMVLIGETMEPKVYYNWLKKIGMGGRTGIDLPSEASGQMADETTFLNSALTRATNTFGQGIALTPIQLAQLTSALANGGRLITPHVVRGLFDSKGRAYWQPKLSTQQIFSPATTKAVLPMMEEVVAAGTGKAAQVSNYRVGGKTGTAEKALAGGGYSTSAYITSFVSIIPIDAPRYVVVAVIDEPAGDNAYGGVVAAPLVKVIMEELVAIKNVPPSSAGEVHVPTAAPEEP